ncbi:MAG TPA: DUF5522 domain-containing protein [Chloroflexota bacterium]
MDDDIFDEDGALTAQFLLARGYCCGNGCRNCPYEPRHGGLDARVPSVSLDNFSVGDAASKTPR